MISLLWAAPTESPIALAATLAGDGNIDRAISVLAQVDQEKLGAEAALFHTTEGLIALEQRRFANALSSFELALELINTGYPGPKSNVLYIYIAQCHVSLDNPSQALLALEQADQEQMSTHLLWIQAHQDLEDLESAWNAQQKGQLLFPNAIPLRYKKIELTIALGLFSNALDELSFFSENEQVQASDLLWVAAQLREVNALDEAAMFLQAARYRFIEEEVWKASAVIALQREQWTEAGEILQVLALHDAKYAIEAAEAYRQADLHDRALLQNGFAPPSEAKTRQRLSLLLEQQEYERVVALEQRLQYWDLTQEDPIRYGLAYSFFQLKEYDAASQYLKGISDNSVFQQAIGLRRAIENCIEQGCP